MIQSESIDGHIDGSTFVRTEIGKPKKLAKLEEKDIRNIETTLLSLLRGTDNLDIARMEKQTGVDRTTLRRTLIILLGDGIIQGTLEGDLFILNDKMDMRYFVGKLVDELKAQVG